MDFCIRTTTKNVSTCRNLAVDLGALARLPSGHASQAHAQRRPLSCPNEGWEELQDYVAHAPKDRLERFSLLARIKAKITFTRTPEDDGFRVLEILSVPKL
jgi:hypothetical protein